MIKNKIKTSREQQGLTQARLAEKANLSIRTIQRIESGKTIPKGHTLNVLSEALAIEKNELFDQQPAVTPIEKEENLRLKFINLSSFCFIGIPFGNIIVPLYFWLKNQEHPKVSELGGSIISFQITWTLCTAFLLILSPFLQAYFPLEFPLILIVGLLAAFINIYFIIKTSIALKRKEYDVFPLNSSFL